MSEVYKAIAAVTGELSKDGIAKDRKNTGQGYNFRGIDEVYNALSPILARNHLCIIPRVLDRQLTERKSNNGGVLFSVTVHVAFDFVSAVDASKHEVITYGEAMDSGDKATNKAMSAAYKYAAMMTFCIPTEGDNDADATTHTLAVPAKPAPPKPATDKAAPTKPPATKPTPAEAAKAWAEKTAAAFKATNGNPDEVEAMVGDRDIFDRLSRLEKGYPDLFKLVEEARQEAMDRAADARILAGTPK